MLGEQNRTLVVSVVLVMDSLIMVEDLFSWTSVFHELHLSELSSGDGIGGLQRRYRHYTHRGYI